MMRTVRWWAVLVQVVFLAAGGVGAGPSQAASEVTLSLWTGFPETEPFYKAAAADYAKTHPNVKVTILSTTLREHEQKLSAAVPTGTGPDIYDVGSNISAKFIDGGFLDPNPPNVDRYLKSGAWNAFVVNYMTINGKTYGLPLDDGSRASLFYNKTLFREAGIGQPPATFTELMADARKLAKVDASGKMTRSGISLRLSGQGSGITEKFRFILEPAGGSLIVRTASGKWHNGFDNEAGQAALQFYVDAVQKYHVDDPKIQHDADAFVAGNTAMLMREAWVIGEINDKNPKLDYGVVPIPKWKRSRMLLQPFGFYVNKTSANKDVAWDFLQFLTSKENAIRLTTMTGWVSERQDVDWKPLLSKTPQFAVFVSPPKGIEFYQDPVIPVFDEIQTKMATRLTAAYIDPSLNGNPAKIASAIHQMAAEADELLKGAGVYGTQ